MSDNVLFMIERGKALELVKKHIAEKRRVADERVVLARELGVEDIYVSRFDGTLTGVMFKDAVHPEFKKPDRKGVSFPKKGTAWRARFDDQKGYPDPSSVISKAFSIPLVIEYGEKGDEFSGWTRIGNPLQECGFLYLGAEGPYAMWTPDVPQEVKKAQERGQKVKGPALTFKLEFDGCRRIDREEWDLLVAQHNFDRKRKSAA
jgi:hypothetical protein